MFAALMSGWTMPFECSIWVSRLPMRSTPRTASISTIDLVSQCLSLQQFHGDEGSPIGLVNLVDRAYVRMIQRGRSFRFPPESAEGLRVVGEFVGQELQGDVAAELQVFRLIHHTHTPAADPTGDPLIGDLLPNDC